VDRIECGPVPRQEIAMRRLVTTALTALLCLPACSAPAQAPAPQDHDAPVGYSDTPLLPDGRWRVHDIDRPVPDVVTPGEARDDGPPSDAIVLFDGTDLSAWRSGDQVAQWKLVGNAMEVNGTGSIETAASFRGNSGVFFMGRYEVQILDSFENRSYADGQAAALYGQHPPLVNASRPPGEWQSYDIVFIAPVFEGERLVAPARATVFHNGVLVHHDRPFIGATTHRSVAQYAPHPPQGPLALQDHGNPMRFRNIWIRPLGTDGDAPPADR
jgi:hypothetical protein